MTRLRIALLTALVLLLAACGASAPSGGAVTAPPASTGAGTGGPATAQPATAGPGSSESPGVETAEPTEPAATGTPAGSPGDGPDASASAGAPGLADACSGSASNREFFTKAAMAVAWPVLCGVLPKGWFVSSGTYRLANGGKLLISYRGPGGATLALSEGAFCSAADGCVPAGTGLGDAAMGPLEGTLVGLDDGGFAIVAARGENPSWLLVAQGLDQQEAADIAAALAQVGG